VGIFNVSWSRRLRFEARECANIRWRLVYLHVNIGDAIPQGWQDPRGLLRKAFCMLPHFISSILARFFARQAEDPVLLAWKLVFSVSGRVGHWMVGFGVEFLVY